MTYTVKKSESQVGTNVKNGMKGAYVLKLILMDSIPIYSFKHERKRKRKKKRGVKILSKSLVTFSKPSSKHNKYEKERKKTFITQ